MPEVAYGPRHGGWRRPVSVPDDLGQLHGPATGEVRLPLRVYSSGRGSERTFDLSDRGQVMEMYQVVLNEGALDDVCRFVNAHLLREVWPHLWLPQHVRRAWERQVAVTAR